MGVVALCNDHYPLEVADGPDQLTLEGRGGSDSGPETREMDSDPEGAVVPTKGRSRRSAAADARDRVAAYALLEQDP